MNETENQTRLRRTKEALDACRAAEDVARRALALAVESTKKTKERYEELFMLEEKQAAARMTADYRHTTN